MKNKCLTLVSKWGGGFLPNRLLLLLICALWTLSVSAQTRTVTGLVTDDAGNPMPGVTILVKGTSTGTVADVNGKYSIKVGSDAALEFSFIGFLTQIVNVDGRSVINIAMKEDVKSLDEVVVVAYGAQKKSSITGAISQVNAETLAKRPVSSVTSTLEGNTPGVMVTGSYGAAGAAPTIIIRGVGTVNGSTAPLYVIDGVPFAGSISDINPDDIESMSVLKDAASCALYGNRAANGVILITTKKAKSEKVTLTFKTNQGVFQRGIPEYDVTNADEWMTSIFNAVRNNQYTKNVGKQGHEAALSAATAYAQANTIEDIVKLNIYDVADSDLFMADGSLNPKASILPGYRGDLDWYDQVIGNGYRSEYLLSGSGASERSDYFFSVGYLDENGYVKKNGFSRLSARGVINLKPTKWLKSGLNLSSTYQKFSNAKGNGDDDASYTNAFSYCRSIAPVYPVHLHYTNDGITNPAKNGEFILDGAGNPQWDPGYYNVVTPDGKITQITTRNQNSGRHMIWENEVNKDRSKYRTINGTVYADVMLPYNIVATVKGTVFLRNTETEGYDSSIVGDGASANGRYKNYGYNYSSYTFQQQLRWNYTFNDKHNVGVLLGHENYDYRYTYRYDFKTNEILLGGAFPSNFTTLSSMDGYSNYYTTESYLGRVQYNYDDRYNLEASFRRDGSSRFAKGHRWGSFGSVGVNWVFSNEAFMKNLNWLDNGKLRANWGRVGNDRGVDSYYASMALMGVTKYGGEGAVVVQQKAAEDLTWETGESWGIGIDTRLFNRWNLTLEYYHRINRNLLFSLNDPASAGSVNNSQWTARHSVNFGEIANYGVEINTDVNVVATKDWTVNIGMNLTSLKNKVLKMPEVYAQEGYRSGSQLIMEGKSRYEWNTYTYCGVDMTDGNAIYLPDYDKYYIEDNDQIIGSKEGHTKLASSNWRKIGDQYYVTNPSSYGGRSYKGSALPKAYGSFQGNFRYKNFSVSAMFTYSLGGKVLDNVYSSLMTFSGNPKQFHKDVLNSWTPEMAVAEDAANRINTSINPQINETTYTTNNATSDRWLTKRNYIVFKNLNCSYSLPRNFLNKIDIQNATIGFACENLFTKTARKGMDAQQGLSGYQYNYLTTPRVFTFSLALTI